MRRIFLAFTVAIILCAGTSFAQVTRGTIRVEVLDLHNSNGDVKCALFNGEAGFPGDSSKAFKTTTGTIQNNRAVCDFIQILPGDDYAIAVFHDENGNGQLDTFLGIPREGVGASNDPSTTFGPPKYEEAKFKYSGGTQPVTIHIHYLSPF